MWLLVTVCVGYSYEGVVARKIPPLLRQEFRSLRAKGGSFLLKRNALQRPSMTFCSCSFCRVQSL